MSGAGPKAPIALALLLALATAQGQSPTLPGPPVGDQVAAPRPPADTAPARTAAAQDTANRPKSRADTVLVVKHRFNHREQIITGSVVMSCLALMMVVMNNYNPR